MIPWLKETSNFQRIALGLFVITGLAWISMRVSGAVPPTEILFLAAIVLFQAFRKRILWRVRNRLLLTYFFFGVVPVFLIYGMVYFTTLLTLGQIASERVKHELESRIESIHAIAQDLTAVAPHQGSAELLEQIREREPLLA